MSSTFFAECTGLDIGVATIRCFNEQAAFSLGWMIIIMLVLIIWNNLALEPTKDRLAVVSFIGALASMLFIASGFLPDDAFVYFLIAAIGSIVALVFRR